MTTSRARIGSLLIVLLLALPASAADEPGERGLIVRDDDLPHTLSLDGAQPFHTTSNELIAPRLIGVPGSMVRVALWSEAQPDGQVAPYYGISLDGSGMAAVRRTSYVIELRHGKFDPAKQIPPVETSLAADDASNLYLVQFVSQPLEEYRASIRSLGGTVQKFIANHTHYVKMTPGVRDGVAALPFVRWVGPVHPAYKLEEEIREQIVSAAQVAPRRYSIMLHERGLTAQNRVVTRIEAMGGTVHGTTPQGFRIEATLSLEQVRVLSTLDDVMFIDRKSRLEVDMDVVRQTGGADYLETVAGFTGQGVRAEVADSELDVDHPEWSAPPIIHRAGGGIAHGTSVYGILFAQGLNAQARGLIPDGVGIFAQSDGLLGGGPTRYTHTAELIDPAGPYRAVLQTNSTGDSRTFFYTTISAEMDDLLFINDFSITQSQSNAGNQDSRPQAWAKNIISGGAVNHYNTLDRSDDCWCNTGSIGPADDGRIKPDLSFFYDSTFAPSSGGGYTEFGGTSGATPSIAGHLGLFYQMWSEGVFGNEVPVPGGTVFENRPHMTTAKAALINTATQYPFSSTTDDLTRVHQGWGVPSVQYLYDIREKIGFIDETELLGNLESVEFVAFVETGEPELRVTMTYADPMGTPGASAHRVNDLTLKVTSPSSTVYWGNNGLLEGNWSVPGGTANTIDTVENVFVQNPEPGVWAVEVVASEINEDGHVETPELDADFALVVSGASLTNCTSAGRMQLNRSLYACDDVPVIRVVDCDLNTSDSVIDTVAVTIDSTTEPGGETVLLTETAETTADFRGSIALSQIDGAGVLQVSDADVVTATYVDADDGQGGTGLPVQDTAVLDCAPPVISNIQVNDVSGFDAKVSWDTNEPANSLVTYGTTPPGSSSVSADALVTSHFLNLESLEECTVYSFAVSSTDDAGNTTTDDNSGTFYSFATGVNNQPGFVSSDTPIAIPDNNATGATSTISVGDTETVLDVDVLVHVSHTYDGDLTLSLIAPNATNIVLSNRRGGSGNNFIDTLFDDEAAVPIASGSAPFTGSFQPDEPLGTLDGISAQGDWQLKVVDQAGADLGNIESWTLILTFPAQACGAEASLTSHQLEVEACASSAAGVGNNLWEAGERIEFSLTLHNPGTAPLTSPSAIVTPLTAGVTMLDASATLDDLAPGGSGNTRSPHFIAELSEGLTCGQPLDFQVDMISDEGMWPASFQQIVGEPIAERSGLVLDEDFQAGIPAAWTVVDGSTDGFTWYADDVSDPAGCASADPAAPVVGTWVAVDSSCTGGGNRMDEELISPVLDLTGEFLVTLEFDHWFQWSPARRDEVGDVDVRSSLTGGQWVNVGQWTGASTANPEHAVIDISTQAANAPDVQVRWHYYEAQRELTWYVDNIQVGYFEAASCNMASCAPPAASPPPVPDGSGGFLPMQPERLALDGSQLSITWDDQCASGNTKILYGPLDQVSSHSLSGSECGIANPQTWSGVPAGSLWFVLVGDDGLGVESSWGQGSDGERNGLQGSGTCGSSAKDLAGTCP